MFFKKTLPLLFLLTCAVCTSQAQVVNKGIDLMLKERFNDARVYFKQQLASDAKHAATYTFYLGEVCYKQEKYDSARAYYMQAMNLDEKEPLSYAGLGKVSFEKNNVEGQKNFEKAISLAKKTAEPYNVIAEYFIATKDVKNADKALLILQEGLKAEPKNFYTHVLIGDAYLLKNDGSFAMSYFNKASYMNASSPVVSWKKGVLYTNARNYDEGMKMFQEGLALDAEFGPIYREIGELYYKAKQYKKAIENYQLYLQKIDNNDDAQFRYGAFLYLTQDYKTALEVFDKLEQRKYSNTVMLRLKAFCLYEAGSYDKGLEYLNKFMKETAAEKYLPVDYEYLAKLYIKKDNDSMATKNVELACLADSSKFDLWTDLGNYYYSKSKYGAAVISYNKKFEKIKADDNDYLNIGKAYYFDKKYKEADSTFTYLTISRPTAYIGYIYRARSNAYLDADYKTGQAKPHYEKVIELCAPEEAKFKDPLVEAYQYMATYYMYKKDKVNADMYWNKVLKLEPGNKRAADGLKVK
jgi:tetratricopeptide (TPR) repeat protein